MKRPARPRTVAIAGLGLIGGSLARAVKSRGLPYRVSGVARRPETLQQALDAGAVDNTFTTAREGARRADLVVLALPVRAIPDAAREIAPVLSPGTVVTDVGSTKAALVRRVEETLPPGTFFVGGHPLAGTEDSGFPSSFPELFDGARCILTPGDRSSAEATELVTSLWKGVGARVEVMSTAVHDHIVAVISHLPHMVAYALVNAAAGADRTRPGLLDYTGGGFRDFTRIAASHPAMWRDICLDNREEILAAIDRFTAEIARIREAVDAGDEAGMEGLFAAARRVRRSLAPGRAEDEA